LRETYCCGDIDPKVVAESVNGELLLVECVEEGGKKGPPVKVKWLILENGVLAGLLLP